MVDMDLSGGILEGLKIASNKTYIGDKQFLILLKTSTESLFDPKRCELLKGITGVEQKYLKQSFGALTTVLVEAAKHDKDADSLRQILEDSRCSSERSTQICDIYEQYKEQLRALLARTGAGTRHIVDVDWRLDYCIKTNQMEKVGQPVYVIDLKTKLPGSEDDSIQDIQLSCTRDQLQDLVSKLRDACKCLERSSHSQ